MRIEIIDKDLNIITDFELDSNPFKVGELFYPTVVVVDKEFWQKEEIRSKTYKIVEIKHFIRQIYGKNHKYSSFFSVSVTVEEVID